MWWLIAYLIGVVLAFLVVYDFGKYNPNAFGKRKMLAQIGLSFLSWLLVVAFLAVFYRVYMQENNEDGTI